MRKIRRQTARSIGLVLFAVLAMMFGTAVTPASAAPSTPPPHVLADLHRTDERGALARLALNTKYADDISTMSLETFADIACIDYGPIELVRYKGWGVDYPTFRLTIYVDTFYDGKWWKTIETWPYPSATGSWSTSTGEDWAPFDDIVYMVWVTAFPYDGGARLGRDTDTCEM